MPSGTDIPTREQGMTIARLMRDFNARGAKIETNPFDLPSGYILVTLDLGENKPVVAGIDRQGQAST